MSENERLYAMEHRLRLKTSLISESGGGGGGGGGGAGVGGAGSNPRSLDQ